MDDEFEAAPALQDDKYELPHTEIRPFEIPETVEGITLASGIVNNALDLTIEYITTSGNLVEVHNGVAVYLKYCTEIYNRYVEGFSRERLSNLYANALVKITELLVNERNFRVRDELLEGFYQYNRLLAMVSGNKQ
jgi:hypothetical protein